MNLFGVAANLALIRHRLDDSECKTNVAIAVTMASHEYSRVVPSFVSSLASHAGLISPLAWLDTAMHLFSWVTIIILEALFQTEYVTNIEETLLDTHWSWPIMHASIVSLALPFIVIVAMWAVHLCFGIEHGKLAPFIGTVMYSSIGVSICFTFLEFFNLVLMDVTTKAVHDFGALPTKWVALIFFKVYTFCLIKHHFADARADHATSHHPVDSNSV